MAEIKRTMNTLNYFAIPGVTKTVGRDAKLAKVNEIITFCCREFDIPRDDIFSNTRKNPIKDCRQVAMYLIKTHTRLSWMQIGSKFNKDHATAIHAHRVVKNQIETNVDYSMRVQYIERVLVRLFDDFIPSIDA